MRTLEKLLPLLDRTAVLFVGIALGAAIGISFFTGGGDPTSEAKATAPAIAAVAPADQGPDRLGPRLSEAIERGRTIDIGVFGDSFGDGIWAGLYHQLRGDERFKVHQFARQSTGFTRYRTLNLLDDTRARLDRQPVDIAVVSFGANDTQGIYAHGTGVEYASAEWQQIVGERVDALVQLLRDRGATVYWVGLPKMRDAGFDVQIHAMNDFYTRRMNALHVPFIDTVQPTVDAKGNYQPYLPNPKTGEPTMMRANDGIHMTMVGYNVLTRGLGDRIRQSVERERADIDQRQRALRAANEGARGTGSHG